MSRVDCGKIIGRNIQISFWKMKRFFALKPDVIGS